MNILIGLFFWIHGLIHLAYVSPTPPAKDGPVWPFDLSKTWLMPNADPGMLKGIGALLVILSTVGFILAGLAMLGWLVPAAWLKTLLIASSVSSIILMAVFWHNNFVVGIGLSVAILLLTIFLDWPQKLLK